MAFRTALSGLNAASTELNVTGNNVANVNTTGFKSSRAQFADVINAGALGVSNNTVGSGVRLAAVQQQFGQGNVEFTDNNLDLAISGEGFFTLADASGYVYTRNGAFNVDRDGFVVNTNNQRLQTYPRLDIGGFNTGALEDLRLQTTQSPPQASGTGTVSVNLPANAPTPPVAVFSPTDPQSYNHSTTTAVYDSLGSLYDATFFFIKTPDPNEWAVAMTIDGTQVGGVTAMEFSSTGGLIIPVGGNVAFPAYDPGSGADDIQVTFDFAESTQYGNQFGVNAITQDGFTSGRLTSIDIDENGIVFARFTNGRATELGQLAMSNFPNTQGLRQLGDTTWGESFASGNVIRGQPGSASFGLIQSGALEGSNVDITKELVTMITAQRNFQANAQMITTEDQVTQTIINIR
jgi:flagellar hook protein FlgE